MKYDYLKCTLTSKANYSLISTTSRHLLVLWETMFEQKLRLSGIYLAKTSHLKCVCHSVQKFNDKQWGDFSLDDREEEELAPVYGDEVVVWGLQDRGHILRVHCLPFGLEKVIANTPVDDPLPMFLQEDVS